MRPFDLQVKDRDGWMCQYCGASFTVADPWLDCAHIFGRGAHPDMKWDLDNAMALCHPCHMRFTDHPAAWWEFVEKHIGSAQFEELSARAHGKRDRV